MISIYTRSNNILTKEFWKWVARKILRKYSGPDAVLDSLTRGLTELEIPFEVNAWSPKYNTVHVLSGVTMLKSMIAKKSKGRINLLIAGPILVKTPFDKQGIIQNQNIDLILFPSQWTKDFFCHHAPQLKQKIKVWAAGVKIPEKVSHKKNILVYKKDFSESIFNNLIRKLDQHNLQYEVIKYGSHDQRTYHQKLKEASLLIYLQKTESQGLALQEAWAHDVGTLVYQSTHWESGNFSWDDAKISAPYLEPENGMYFSLETFDEILTNSINNLSSFKARDYCIKYLSDKVSVQNYLSIIKEYVK